MNKTIKHILYADDDPDDVELFSEAVEKVSSMTLTHKIDGRDFVNSLNNLPVPDLIVLDMRMPF